MKFKYLSHGLIRIEFFSVLILKNRSKQKNGVSLISSASELHFRLLNFTVYKSVYNSHFSHLSSACTYPLVFSSAKRHNHLQICSAAAEKCTYPKSAKINFRVSYILIFRVSGCTRFGSPRIAKKFPKFAARICSWVHTADIRESYAFTRASLKFSCI